MKQIQICTECGKAEAAEPTAPFICAQCECPHDERDHGMCLECGHEEDPGEAIDRAMDFYEGDR